MATGITNFRNSFKGTRPNRFLMNIASPVGAGLGSAKWDIYGKATSIPNQQIGVIPVPWMGRVIKFSGERLFPDWTVQIYDASGSDDTRAYFMTWLEKMNTAETHAISYNQTSTATVKFDDFGNTQNAAGGQSGFTRSFKLVHIFPIDVGPLEFSYDASDSFSEFTVTFAYDYLVYQGGSQDQDGGAVGVQSLDSAPSRGSVAPPAVRGVERAIGPLN